MKIIFSAFIEFQNKQTDLDDIEEQLRRLDTLEMIDPTDTNWQWQDFVFHSSLLEVVIEMFKSDMDVSCIIWRRHESHILENFSDSNVMRILNAMPATIKPFHIIQWLKHFAPCILQTHPYKMTNLIDWSIKNIRLLQYSNQKPEFVLEFCNSIYTIFFETSFLFS